MGWPADHDKINKRGMDEQRRSLNLAQALYDAGYERTWKQARRKAADIIRRAEHADLKAMGMNPGPY